MATEFWMSHQGDVGHIRLVAPPAPIPGASSRLGLTKRFVTLETAIVAVVIGAVATAAAACTTTEQTGPGTSAQPGVSADKATRWRWVSKGQVEKSLVFGQCTGTRSFRLVCNEANEGAELFTATDAEIKPLIEPPAQGASFKVLGEDLFELIGRSSCAADQIRVVLANRMVCERVAISPPAAIRP
jgi:hypothetical protein